MSKFLLQSLFVSITTILSLGTKIALADATPPCANDIVDPEGVPSICRGQVSIPIPLADGINLIFSNRNEYRNFGFGTGIVPEFETTVRMHNGDTALKRSADGLITEYKSTG